MRGWKTYPSVSTFVPPGCQRSGCLVRVLEEGWTLRSLPTSRHSGVGLCDAVRACGIVTPVGSRGTASFQRGMMSYHGQLGGEAPVGSCGTDSFLAWNDGLPQAARRHKPDYTCVGLKTRLNNDIKPSLPPRERLGIAGKESPRVS
uniref:Uncharacterized protein n=1 Tax=Ananas comosus var. bracteatus TaxID=296719 RepID=A0A6V7NTA4_ANACO|nr:unnamed protein product [Ananas comosus var. bracteatus]